MEEFIKENINSYWPNFVGQKKNFNEKTAMLPLSVPGNLNVTALNPPLFNQQPKSKTNIVF